MDLPLFECKTNKTTKLARKKKRRRYGERVDMHHVFEAFEEKFCAPLSCVGRQTIVEHGVTLELRSNGAADGPGSGYYLLGTALLLALAFLYGFVLCAMGERGVGGAGELRRRRRGGWLGFGAKAKAL